MNQTWENSKKPSFRPDFGPFDLNLGQFFFSKNLAPSVPRYHGLLYQHVQYQKKTNDPILRKLWEGRTDGQTDGREWFHKTLPWSRASKTCARVYFLIKLQAEVCNFINKRNSSTGIFLWILRNFLITSFDRTYLGDCFCWLNMPRYWLSFFTFAMTMC